MTAGSGGDRFARIPVSLLTSAQLSHGAVRLYGILDRHANDNHECWPTRSTLATEMGISRSGIDRFTKHLVHVGAITVTPRMDERGDPTSNLYFLVARERMVGGGRDSGGTPESAPTPTGKRVGGGRDSAVTGSRETAPQNESQGEREPGECVDLACSKLSTDTPKQHDEARVKIAALVAIHGEDAVRSELDAMPDACIPFGGELARILKDRLGEPQRPAACPRCNDTGQTSTGYVCGCPGTSKRRVS